MRPRKSCGSTVPEGAGDGLRMTVLASLERQTSLTSDGRLVLLAQSHARDRALFTDRLSAKAVTEGGREGPPARPFALKPEA